MITKPIDRAVYEYLLQSFKDSKGEEEIVTKRARAILKKIYGKDEESIRKWLEHFKKESK